MKDAIFPIINEWIYHNNRLKEINKFLFDNTELFEEKYCSEFNDELFRFFAGKITRYTKDYNELYKRLKPEERKKLNEVKILRR